MATRDASTEHEQGRSRLAQLVRERRLQLGLSVRAAADNGGLARGTWIGLEEGTRRTADNNYAAIEHALHWTTGSVGRILEGGDPGIIQHVAVNESLRLTGGVTAHVTTAAQAASDRDEALARVMRSDLDDELKAQIVQMLIAEKREAEKQRLKRAEQLIHLFEERA